MIHKCPHCGGEPEHDTTDRHGRWWDIHCCGAAFVDQSDWNCYATAVAHAHTHAENAALRAKLDELREAVRAEHTAYSNAEACSCPACMRDFDDAYKKIERLLTEGE